MVTAGIEKVHMYDEFLREMIGLGVTVPREYEENPSRLGRDELVGIIDSSFKPFDFHHVMLLQLLRCREEVYIRREKVPSPEMVGSSETADKWNKKSSADFKRWYLEEYTKCPLVVSCLDNKQRAYAVRLAKDAGEEKRYREMLLEKIAA